MRSGRSRWTRVGLLLFMLALLTSACAPAAAPSAPSANPSVPVSESPRARKTLVAAIAAPVPPFGPLGRTGTYAGMINYIEAHSQGLVTSDGQGRPIPQLAKELPSLDKGTAKI